jgi:hypothetical protein
MLSGVLVGVSLFDPRPGFRDGYPGCRFCRTGFRPKGKTILSRLLESRIGLVLLRAGPEIGRIRRLPET